ncbi:MAG TPA: hypothetical protein PKW33_05270 [Anaerolineaceae bacterium]|nr:hypothetical protein [Anaerolineaceae bacterium]HPN50975.1 hypothetical protein [Anaerolineaceae bacterium]
MSVSWGVLPITPEIHGWLRDSGFEKIPSNTRRPTLDELLSVIASLNLPIQMQTISKDTVGISVGEAGSAHYAYLLGGFEGDAFAFQFFGSDCRERTMLEIVKGLSQKHCQALVIYESGSAIPIIVDAKTDIDEAIAAWHRKFKQQRND